MLSTDNWFVVMLWLNGQSIFGKINYIFIKKGCIECIPYFRYGNCVCLNYIDKRSKNYHELLIHSICLEITIMVRRVLLRDNLIKMIMNYVENMIIPERTLQIHIIEKLLIIHVWNIQIQEKKGIFFYKRWF